MRMFTTVPQHDLRRVAEVAKAVEAEGYDGIASMENQHDPFLALAVAGLVCGWSTWSVLVPRWRLWAYQRVDDVPALLEEAAQRQVIWPKGSFFERTEYRPPALAANASPVPWCD